MSSRSLTLLIMALIASLSVAKANPVAFEGATQITGSYQGPMSSFEAYHTYDERVAFGLNAERLELPEGDRLLAGLQHNWLVKRWNLKNSQGNFYAGAGGGYGWIQDQKQGGSPYGRVAFFSDSATP